MKIFVTGGAGYIGSACVEYLLDNNHEVTVFDSLIKGHRKAIDYRAIFIQGDLSDASLLNTHFKNNKYDAIIHFAGFSLVGESMLHPGSYFRNNISNGINLLEAAVIGNVKKIVFSSTAAVYGLPEKMPITEDTEPKPINPYGESKLFFEKMLKWYNVTYGIKYVSLRYFNAAGASKNFGEDHNPETHLIPLILKVAKGEKEAIQIYGDDYDTPDGTCIRDYIHILDLAEAHMLALYSDKSGCYNLGTGTGFSVKEIINVARKITGHDIPTLVIKRRPGDPAKLIADSNLARKELKWTPKYENIEKIISSAWEWSKKFPNGYNN